MTDFEYQIECTTRDMADKLVENFSMTVPQALRVVYNSKTYDVRVRRFQPHLSPAEIAKF